MPSSLGVPFDREQISRLFPNPVGVAALRLSDRVFPLFPEEERAISEAVPKRRREFSAGRHCARLAMAQLGYAGCAIPSGIDRAPIWPSGLIGSITHSERYCAVTIARSHHFKSIGIDLEAIKAVPAEVSERVLRPDEIDPLDLGASPDGADWLTLHFCLKEAAYKAFYHLFRRIIDFQEMKISVNRRARSFFAEAAVEGLKCAPVFHGKYLVKDEIICAACWSEHLH